MRLDCKYKESMCDEVIKVAQAGGFHVAMCLKLDISRASFDNYRKKYPEFAAAVEKADMITQANSEQTMLDLSKNKNEGHFQAASFLLKTKFKEDYPSDVPATETTSNSITINNLNLTNEERDHKITQLSDKLRSAGFDLSSLLNPTTKIIEEIPTDDCPDE